MRVKYEEKAKIDGVELSIQCILMQIGNKKNDIVPHYHEYIELLYVFTGKIEVWMGGNSANISQGEFVLINSKVAHTVNGIYEDNSYLVVKIAPEVLYVSEQFLYDFKYIIPFLQISPSQNKVFSKDDLKDSIVHSLFENMLQEWTEKGFGYELAIKTNVYQLFLWIIRHCHQNDASFNTDFEITDELATSLQRAIDYVDKNYVHATTKEVAQICNLSYSYFSRSFKKLMNKSFSQYLNSVRISKAESLIVTTNLSITEIALQVGYSTSSHFIQEFRKQKGISPKQFRDKFLNKHVEY